MTAIEPQTAISLNVPEDMVGHLRPAILLGKPAISLAELAEILGGVCPATVQRFLAAAEATGCRIRRLPGKRLNGENVRKALQKVDTDPQF